jgi:hypothetical protein
MDYEFCRWLCREKVLWTKKLNKPIFLKKLAAIPPSAFYSPQNRPGNDHCVRLCFFKVQFNGNEKIKFYFQKDETLQRGIEILRNSFPAKK